MSPKPIKYLFALFFALCVQNVNAEVSPIQSTGGGSSTVIVSSCSAIPATPPNQTSFVVASASVTLTVSGTRPVKLILYASITDASNESSFAGFTENSVFRSGYTSATGISACYQVGSGNCNLSTTVPLSAPSAGSYTYAIMFRGTSGGVDGFASGNPTFCVEQEQ